MLQQSDKAHLDVVGQAVEAADAGVRSLLYLGTHHVVVAGQHDLDEVRVGQVTVLVAVEEVDEARAVTDAGSCGVCAEKLEHGLGVDALLRSSVDPAES